MIQFKSAAKFGKGATIIFFTEEQVKNIHINFSNPKIQKLIKAIIKSKQFTGAVNSHFPLISEDISSDLVLLVGLGTEKEFSATSLRISVKKACDSSYLSKIKDIEIIPSDVRDETIISTIEGILLGTYRWIKYKTKESKEQIQKNYSIISVQKKIHEDSVKICNGTNLARDLVNENADVATSTYIEQVIKKTIKGHKDVTIEILNEKEMKSKGLGLHLAVNQGSVNPPKLIIVKYSGASKFDKYTALVGKGMTFDTGGLNLKPSGSIESMRIDMGGSATVVGVLKSVLDLKLKKNIIFVCAMAENVTGSKSYKPGDVIKGYAGKTVEIANTDAEGRLVLADAISYIIKNYKPARLIDMATLTGACVVALGNDYTALVSTDEDMAKQLLKSSSKTDDRLWQLPSYPELKDSVKSQIADIRNLGFPRGAGGTITAAEFLRQFADGTKWAHLDIAGTSFVEGQGRMYFNHGATGSGVRLLTNFLQQT